MRKFATAMLRNEEIHIYDSCTRDYTHVSDAVDGLLRALDYAVSGKRGAFNIARGQSVPTLDLVALIERCLSRKARVRLLPMQPGDAKHTLASIERAKKELGFCPSIGIEDGVRSFLRWLTGR